MQVARCLVVNSFAYDTSREMGFCEVCIGGKQSRNLFPISEGSRSLEPLHLGHSDICGKNQQKN